mgnify:CR=1 FL=1
MMINIQCNFCNGNNIALLLEDSTTNLLLDINFSFITITNITILKQGLSSIITNIGFITI